MFTGISITKLFKPIRKVNRKNIFLFLAILGPGIITANVDNDAGGITTYSLAGAHYGYTLLWVMIPTMIALVVIQEMCARMGAVTGKGLSDLIRESFGVKVTFYVMIALLLTNMGNSVSEFAGIAASLELFGISKYVSVPISAVLVWLLVVKGSYKVVEKVFLVACMVYIAYPVAAFMAGPQWGTVLKATVVPSFRMDSGYLITLIGVVGTTIAPWMQFYQQSAVVEKGITIEQYSFSRMDVIVGCLMAIVVAFFIVVACAATINLQGLKVETAADAALALKPLVGEYASSLFAFGLFNASLFAACILPLSTSYYVCEGMGWESGIDKDFRQAPQFFWLFTIIIVISALTILLPNVPLIMIMFISQVVNGTVLPFVLIFMLLLINDKSLMGNHTNGHVFNFIAWITVVVMIGLTLLMTADLLSPGAVGRIFGF
ncbi:NRAMP family manganese transport membrane protein [Geotalea daltonii FRC-32]|uniref:NRAMP family manganese transport membrane protein n=1 Tax=Geotalea daltonii (strain DSM 22248 / JCM 15807 / FRC-32) TaxID=316067 RepID=B9M3G6_GEODF|nr:Nramp family divalent metal transporter [Geotalea daltonii]ACM21387.1 NRAMP family manganese transport membrane protein [Geotalea daltonii FRC-32]